MTASAAFPHVPNWSTVLETLLEDKDLDTKTAQWVMTQMLSGNTSPTHISAFLVAFRAKGESPSEVMGLVAGMRAASVNLDVTGASVDTCGTGGDKSDTVNLSTMAAVVAAAAGAQVVKHGNRAASSQSGSADVLEALGVAIDLAPDLAAAAADELGITFCFAPVFHPAMRHVGPVRRELGIRTVFNILGPLVNPGNPAAQVLGVPTPEIGQLMAAVLSERGTKALIVHGDDGLDEFSVHAATQVWDLTGSNARHEWVDPASLSIAAPAADALRGGSAVENAAIFRALLAKPTAKSLAGIRNAVALNAAGALVAFSAAGGTLDVAVGDPDSSLTTRLGVALDAAYAALESGAAERLLDRWIETSQSLATS